jgi:hypothetical protein
VLVISTSLNVYSDFIHKCCLLMNLEISQQIFEKYSNTKFIENPSSVSPVVACAGADGWTDGQTDMAKLTVGFTLFTGQTGP